MHTLIDSRKIGYTDRGKGRPVMLLHGYLESSEIWDDFANRLSEKYRVIAMDLPGHGSSEVFGETHSMELMADVAKKLLDRLGINRVFMAGHSLGGYVTLAFLDRYSDYLSGYSLFHSHPLADSDETREKRKKEIEMIMAGKKDQVYPLNIEKMFAGKNLERFSDTVNWLKEIASRVPGEGMIASLNGMMQRPSRVNLVAEGRARFLWILGAMDNHIQADAMMEKVKIPSNGKIVILTDSGHIGFIEEKEKSFGLFSEFLGQSA